MKPSLNQNSANEAKFSGEKLDSKEEQTIFSSNMELSSFDICAKQFEFNAKNSNLSGLYAQEGEKLTFPQDDHLVTHAGTLQIQASSPWRQYRKIPALSLQTMAS